MNLSLFDKLDDVQIKPTQTLSEHDQRAVDQLQRNYHDALDQTVRLDATLAPLAKTGEWLDRQIEKTRRDIRDAREEEAKDFIRKVVHHFESAYNVTIGDHELQALAHQRLHEEDRDLTQPVITAEEITGHILEHLDGKSFYDVAVDELKNKFRQSLYHGAQPKGRTVRLESFFYMEERYDGRGVRLSYGSEQYWYLLQRALSHFENPSTTDATYQITYALPAPHFYGKDPVGDYNLNQCKRLNSVTVYKNGNVAIKFPTNELAIEFCRTYDLTTPV